MNTGETVMRRMVADIEAGLAHWVERREETRSERPATPEARRQYDAERKRRQRAEAGERS